ncbi:hypothetical protein GQ53DRAFT_818398 [Thozetella sp. PMI_491]|nr:hypothetical protein GQ53DRAFT_818398 [Thozetella sp. PMI_491]
MAITAEQHAAHTQAALQAHSHSFPLFFMMPPLLPPDNPNLNNPGPLPNAATEQTPHPQSGPHEPTPGNERAGASGMEETVNVGEKDGMEQDNCID